MARSRRYYRRSTSQRAVSLFATLLPGPIQRIAETQLGSTLIVIGVPALIVAGILQLEWNGGLPQLILDRNRAQEIRNAAREELHRISGPETVQTIQRWEQSAVDLWNAAQRNSQAGNPSQTYPNPVYPAPQYPSSSYPGSSYPSQTFPGQTYPTNNGYPATGYSASHYPGNYPQMNSNYDYRTGAQQPPLPSSSVARTGSPNQAWQGTNNATPYPNPYQQPYSPQTNYPINTQTPNYNQQPQSTYYQPLPSQNFHPQPLSQQPGYRSVR